MKHSNEQPVGADTLTDAQIIAAARTAKAAHWNLTDEGCLLIGRAVLALASPPRAEQAAPTEVEWPKLDKPASIGGGSFGKGVSSRLLVEAAQRLYERNQAERMKTPEERVADEVNRRALWEMLHGPLAAHPHEAAPTEPPEASAIPGEGGVTKAALEVAFCWGNYGTSPETTAAIEKLSALLGFPAVKVEDNGFPAIPVKEGASTEDRRKAYRHGYEQGWGDRTTRSKHAFLTPTNAAEGEGEPADEYDRLKRQKDAILLKERLKHCACDECGKPKAKGWALYCVSCAEKAIATPAPAQAAPTEPSRTVEAYAMQMLWDDQQPEEKEHYLAVARRAAMGTPAAAEPGKGEGTRVGKLERSGYFAAGGDES